MISGVNGPSTSDSGDGAVGVGWAYVIDAATFGQRRPGGACRRDECGRAPYCIFSESAQAIRVGACLSEGHT